MSEMSKFEALKKKLQGVCDENNLVFRFRNNQYPLTLTIRPINGVAEQMSMLAEAEENGYTSPDAYIVFAYKDGVLIYKTSETFTISDALFSKIKNLYRNMHYLWLQYFYRHTIERSLISAQNMPQIEDSGEYDTDDAGSELSEDSCVEESDVTDDESGEFDGLESENDMKEDADELISEAVRLIRDGGNATVAFLQRSLKIGYARAARIMDELEKMGVVGPYNGSQAREVIPSTEEA